MNFRNSQLTECLVMTESSPSFLHYFKDLNDRFRGTWRVEHNLIGHYPVRSGMSYYS